MNRFTLGPPSDAGLRWLGRRRQATRTWLLAVLLGLPALALWGQGLATQAGTWLAAAHSVTPKP